MGGASSKVMNLWTAEEEMEIKKAKIIQKRSKEFVIKYFFDGSTLQSIALKIFCK
jgi:hypothetical protein